jgi:hypothetical protein
MEPNPSIQAPVVGACWEKKPRAKTPSLEMSRSLVESSLVLVNWSSDWQKEIRRSNRMKMVRQMIVPSPFVSDVSQSKEN